MSLQDTISTLAADPERLESVYQEAVAAGDAAAFQQAIDDRHATEPENLLYAAWFYRLRATATRARSVVIAWSWVIPLALANGLLFWWLSDDDRYMVQLANIRTGIPSNYLPAIILLAAPLSAALVLVYLTGVGRKRWLPTALISLVLLATGGYVLWVYPQVGTRPFQEQYLTLMAMHLPLLAWAGVGSRLVADHRDPINRFGFLIKSLEAFIMAGLFAIAGGIFTGITVGLFAALNIDFPEIVQRLFFAGGGGLIPVVAVAVIYNPAAPPAEQAFDEGLSRLVALLMRFLLPLTLLVLLIYIAFIPFNFWEPFDNRDVLIIYNAMLFAVIALLVGGTPISRSDLSEKSARWLRRGLIAVAALALFVSLYALAAIIYRTALDRLTPNRVAFIGWNVINIGLLVTLLLFQFREKETGWLQGLYRTYSGGTVAYAAWSLTVILAIPWLFGIDQGAVDSLPETVQVVIYEHPSPILLKCPSSPHIYLLDDAQKRWVANIETFNERGYVWRDVRFVSCDDLRSIPDGTPIPADAGTPPQP